MNELTRVIIIFSVVQLINVILNTIKSIITIKGTKLMASTMNAITYGFYTIVVVLTASDSMSLWWKIGLTIATNFIGVYFSMWLLEKMRKDRLWRIDATIKEKYMDEMCNELEQNKISYAMYYIDNGGLAFHLYSYSQKESNTIKSLLQKYNAKYIVFEQNVKL